MAVAPTLLPYNSPLYHTAKMAATESLSPLQLPPVRPLPTQYVQQLQAALHAASWAGVDATRVVLPAPVLLSILAAAIAVLEKEPTLVEVRRRGHGARDWQTPPHGQAHRRVPLVRQLIHAAEKLRNIHPFPTADTEQAGAACDCRGRHTWAVP